MEGLGQCSKFGKEKGVFVLVDMNATVESIETGCGLEAGIEGVNENEQYLVDVCAEKGSFLKHL